jgi:homoserine O-acetyltransferase
MICSLVFWSRARQPVGGHHFGILSSVSLIFLLVVLSFGFPTLGVSQARQDWPRPREGDYIAKAFQFRDGSVLAVLRLHYRVLGQPHRDSSGHVDNAVLILHGTGSVHSFSRRVLPAFSSFPKACSIQQSTSSSCPTTSVRESHRSQAMASMHIFPNKTMTIGCGEKTASRPEALGVDHLRLILGTSMGFMHFWVVNP